MRHVHADALKDVTAYLIDTVDLLGRKGLNEHRVPLLSAVADP